MNPNRKWTVMAGLILLGWVSWASVVEKPVVVDGKQIELSRYAKAYIGPGNVRIEVAPYKRVASFKEGALIRIHGVEGDWDGKVVNHLIRRSGQGDSVDYTADYNGKSWTTLRQRIVYGEKGFYFIAPGMDEEIKVAPSDGAAQLVTPKAILEEYQQQKDSKTSD